MNGFLASKPSTGPARRRSSRFAVVMALHSELSAKGADVVYGPIVQEAYHMLEFAVRDRDGYILGFGQAVGS